MTYLRERGVEVLGDGVRAVAEQVVVDAGVSEIGLQFREEVVSEACSERLPQFCAP